MCQIMFLKNTISSIDKNKVRFVIFFQLINLNHVPYNLALFE